MLFKDYSFMFIGHIYKQSDIVFSDGMIFINYDVTKATNINSIYNSKKNTDDKLTPLFYNDGTIYRRDFNIAFNGIFDLVLLSYSAILIDGKINCKIVAAKSDSYLFQFSQENYNYIIKTDWLNNEFNKFYNNDMPELFSYREDIQYDESVHSISVLDTGYMENECSMKGYAFIECKTPDEIYKPSSAQLFMMVTPLDVLHGGAKIFSKYNDINEYTDEDMEKAFDCMFSLPINYEWNDEIINEAFDNTELREYFKNVYLPMVRNLFSIGMISTEFGNKVYKFDYNDICEIICIYVITINDNKFLVKMYPIGLSFKYKGESMFPIISMNDHLELEILLSHQCFILDLNSDDRNVINMIVDASRQIFLETALDYNEDDRNIFILAVSNNGYEFKCSHSYDMNGQLEFIKSKCICADDVMIFTKEESIDQTIGYYTSCMIPYENIMIFSYDKYSKENDKLIIKNATLKYLSNNKYRKNADKLIVDSKYDIEYGNGIEISFSE